MPQHKSEACSPSECCVQLLSSDLEIADVVKGSENGDKNNLGQRQISVQKETEKFEATTLMEDG